MSNKNNDTSTEITINGTSILIVLAIVIVGGFLFFLFSGNNNSVSGQTSNSSVVSEVEGKQIIEINVQGGYSPSSITAKAGVPTVIRMKSNGAYGCERAFRIPSLGISKTLPSDGNTDIEIASQTAGTKLTGTCSMGMYRFTVNFN